MRVPDSARVVPDCGIFHESAIVPDSAMVIDSAMVPPDYAMMVQGSLMGCCQGACKSKSSS